MGGDFCVGVTAVVQDLHLGAGLPGVFVVVRFYDIIDQAAVAALTDLPLQLQLVVVVALVGHQVTAAGDAVIPLIAGIQVKRTLCIDFPGLPGFILSVAVPSI